MSVEKSQRHRVSAVRVGSRTVVVLALASVAGVAMFFWPLLDRKSVV